MTKIAFGAHSPNDTTIDSQSSPDRTVDQALASGAHPIYTSKPNTAANPKVVNPALRRRRLLQIGWRLMLTALLLAVMVALGILTGATRAGAQSASDPLVLAFYYSWFDQNTWTYDTLSDLPAEPYVSSDRGVMGRHIDQAKAAGIDALIVAWYGPGGGNQTESNLAALLEEAAARNFRIGILFETDSPFMPGTGDAVAGLQHAMATHVNHPAFLRVDGRPVFFFWRTQRYGVDAWRSMRDQADPNRNAIWIADGVDTSYLSVFDGHHLYSNTWSPAANLDAVNQKFAGQVESARQNTGAPKLWVATAMPGYNDIKARGGFAQDREGGGYYARSWAAAINSRPNWVVITSFNEWPEGSYIEPSAAFGDQYLGLTAAYSQQFKGGGGVPVAFSAPVSVPVSVPVSAATGSAGAPALITEPTPFVEPDTPTLFVQTALLNIRKGPGTEFEIVDRAGTGAALAITGRTAAPDAQGEQWWQVFWNGAPGWVSSEFVLAAGPMENVLEIQTAASAGSALNTSALNASALNASAAEITALASTRGINTAAILPGAVQADLIVQPYKVLPGPRPIFSPRP